MKKILLSIIFSLLIVFPWYGNYTCETSKLSFDNYNHLTRTYYNRVIDLADTVLERYNSRYTSSYKATKVNRVLEKLTTFKSSRTLTDWQTEIVDLLWYKFACWIASEQEDDSASTSDTTSRTDTSTSSTSSSSTSTSSSSSSTSSSSTTSWWTTPPPYNSWPRFVVENNKVVMRWIEPGMTCIINTNTSLSASWNIPPTSQYDGKISTAFWNYKSAWHSQSLYCKDNAFKRNELRLPNSTITITWKTNRKTSKTVTAYHYWWRVLLNSDGSSVPVNLTVSITNYPRNTSSSLARNWCKSGEVLVRDKCVPDYRNLSWASNYQWHGACVVSNALDVWFNTRFFTHGESRLYTTSGSVQYSWWMNNDVEKCLYWCHMWYQFKNSPSWMSCFYEWLKIMDMDTQILDLSGLN